ncbi:hypothetical protein [Streptosporangium sandarakinum]|uniref:hypothetical protein n=1 Tax=Streptosporangium sandarakinum TaxID=1260955 RepID=UPI0037B7817D
MEEIRDNLLVRTAGAEREGWLGQAEGLHISLTAAEVKLAPSSSSYGMPTLHDMTGRVAGRLEHD